MKIVLITMLIMISGCKSGNNIKQTNIKTAPEFVPQFIPGPKAFVYKTKGDYYNLVPVLLSEDKTKIIAYPHPSDLKLGNEYQLPTFLNKGYLLDNRGIGLNVAFLKLTYQEYSELQSLPTLIELYSYIIDKDPLEKLCDCGVKSAFTDIENQLNDLIEKDDLKATCKTLKE